MSNSGRRDHQEPFCRCMADVLLAILTASKDGVLRVRRHLWRVHASPVGLSYAAISSDATPPGLSTRFLTSSPPSVLRIPLARHLNHQLSEPYLAICTLPTYFCGLSVMTFLSEESAINC